MNAFYTGIRITVILFGRGLYLNLMTYRLGNCVVCGERIYSDKEYVKSADGYCCKECVTTQNNTEGLEA